MSGTRRWVAPVYALALVVAITAPLLAPGYLLLRDAVSTPRSYLSDEALGLGESAPRALPQDFAVALASHLMDGGVVVKALLVAGLWLAGWGAARLVSLVLPDAGVGGELVAATVAVWNPFVAERLLQGHWSLLVGYGCLPWVAAAMLRLRENARAPRWPLVFWVALAGLTPTGLLLATVVAIVCIAVPGAGRSRVSCAVVTFAVGLAAALPWLTASVVAHSLSSSQTGIAPFAARAEPGLGALGSLAGLGGIWNAQSVPASRATSFAVVGSVLLLAIVAVGLVSVRRRPAAVVLLGLALGAVVVPAVMATGPGISAVEAVVRTLPGLGVVRDGQKWVALAMPGYTLAGAGAVLTAKRWGVIRGGRGWWPAAAAAGVCCVALVGVLPDLAWGVGGRITAVRYPSGWAAVAARINADPRPVAVLPADTMRQFDWSGPAPVLDPLPRWVRAHVWSTGDLTISGQTVFGEGTRARRVQQLLLDGAEPTALAQAGVGWVVVESGTAGEMGSAAEGLTAQPAVYRDGDISLYRIGGDSTGASSWQRAVLVSAHLVWLAALLAGATGSIVAAVRDFRGRRPAALTADR